jgi:hypothetical protein
VTTGPVRDLDFHPDEDAVRVFTSGPHGVLRLSGDAYVSAARYGDVVLCHYAFARHRFRSNLTTGLAGQIVQTGAEYGLRSARSNAPLLACLSAAHGGLRCQEGVLY